MSMRRDSGKILLDYVRLIFVRMVQDLNASNSRKWMYTSLALVAALALLSGFLIYSYSNTQSQLSNLQRQFESLQRDLADIQQKLQIALLQNSNKSSLLLPIPQIYDQIKDSVVLIITNLGQGSGFVYSNEGYIITNYHVIENAANIQASFVDGNIAEASLVGSDIYSDIAVIKVDISSQQLRPVILGNSSDLVVGEQIIAIGNPFGLSGSATSGIVSQLGRELSATGGYVIIDVIQVDAAINPGNSGGPLVNANGEVVGVNTAILSQTGEFSGVGFAIPSDTLRRELPDLISLGKYLHPYVGIAGVDINLAIAERIGLEKVQGFLITDIVEGGPAETAGLQGGNETVTIDGQQIRIGGDVIIGIDDLITNNLNDLVVYSERNKKPGDTIILTVIREQQEISVQLKLGERPLP